MKYLIIVLTGLMSFLSLAAEPVARLTLVPPVSVTSAVSVDIRAGIVPEKAGEYSIGIYIDSEDQDGLLCRQTVTLDKGESYHLKYVLPTAGKAGKHKIIMSVKTPDGGSYMKTDEITVLESARRSPGTIDGAWMGLYHWSETEGRLWNDDIRNLSSRQWRMLVRDMHSLGMDIIVIQEVFRNQNYVGQHDMTVGTYPGKAFYPSGIYPGRMPVKSEDPLEAVFSEADRLGMKVLPGFGLFAWFDFSEESLAWLKLVAEVIWNQITDFFREFDAFCEKMAPGMPIMLATNSMGVMNGTDTYPELLEHLDILCPFGFARMPEGDLTGREAADVLQELCDAAGAHLWFDLEAFLFNPDMSLYPRDISGIVDDLTLLDNFEKILCYQYPGVFNSPCRSFIVGEERTRTLFREYRKYLKGR